MVARPVAMQILVLANFVSIIAERFNRPHKCRFLECSRHDMEGSEVRVAAASIGLRGG